MFDVSQVTDMVKMISNSPNYLYFISSDRLQQDVPGSGCVRWRFVLMVCWKGNDDVWQ